MYTEERRQVEASDSTKGSLFSTKSEGGECDDVTEGEEVGVIQTGSSHSRHSESTRISCLNKSSGAEPWFTLMK